MWLRLGALKSGALILINKGPDFTLKYQAWILNVNQYCTQQLAKQEPILRQKTFYRLGSSFLLKCHNSLIWSQFSVVKPGSDVIKLSPHFRNTNLVCFTIKNFSSLVQIRFLELKRSSLLGKIVDYEFKSFMSSTLKEPSFSASFILPSLLS